MTRYSFHGACHSGLGHLLANRGMRLADVSRVFLNAGATLLAPPRNSTMAPPAPPSLALDREEGLVASSSMASMSRATSLSLSFFAAAPSAKPGMSASRDGAVADAGADVERIYNGGVTVVGIACLYGHFDTIQLLSSHGASRTLPHFADHTAEHQAIHNGHPAIAAFLRAARRPSTA